jgi:hypothetical protein
MIESEAYFESYLHVLRKIKYMAQWESLPLSSYYINGDTQSKIPEYMQEIQSEEGDLFN